MKQVDSKMIKMKSASIESFRCSGDSENMIAHTEKTTSFI